MKIWLFALVISRFALAQTCPGTEDEPAWKFKTAAGPTLIVCGFEDHELQAGKGQRVFTEFSIHAFDTKTGSASTSVFSSEPNETYALSTDAGKTMIVRDLWLFDDKPQAAIERTIMCTGESCAVGAAKCILKLKKNPFPKALAKYRVAPSEELLDQILAQALAGADAQAVRFYTERPNGLDATLSEIYEGNKKKLSACRKELGSEDKTVN